MRAARIEIEEVWQRVSIELARYAFVISSVPPPALDCKSFALIPKISFGGIPQGPSILGEAEAHDRWFGLPEPERLNWMPPLPVISFGDFHAGSATRPRLQDCLPLSGSRSPSFHLIEASEEQQGRELLSPRIGQEQEDSRKQMESGDAIDATGSLDAEIDSEPFPHYYLDDACRFDEIKRNAHVRYGSDFGISRPNVREYVVGAVLDLQTTLDLFWPNLPNDAVACFWKSWQVYNYVAYFCGQLASSRSAEEAAGATEPIISRRASLHTDANRADPISPHDADLGLSRLQNRRNTFVDVEHKKHFEMYEQLKTHETFQLEPFCHNSGFGTDSFHLYMRGEHFKKVSATTRTRIENAISLEYGRRFAL